MQYGSLCFIRVEIPVWPSVVSEESLHGLHADFRSTIAVREGHRGKAVVYSPIFQELLCCTGRKFWASIGGKFVRNTVSHECATEAIDKS